MYHSQQLLEATEVLAELDERSFNVILEYILRRRNERFGQNLPEKLTPEQGQYFAKLVEQHEKDARVGKVRVAYSAEELMSQLVDDR